jgi:hypothetical protein
MIRRFNYTERKRIPRDSIRIAVTAAAQGPMTFDAELNFDGLGLPSDACVWLEAYYRSSYMRFPWGTVGSPLPCPERRLTDIDRGTLVFFRVKVVQATVGNGLILADADKIVAQKDEDGGMSRDSILPVQYVDLGEQIWRLNFDGVPVLEANERIDGIRQLLSADAQFMALVFPSVLREVLQHMLLAGVEDEDDPESWGSLWRRFVKQFHVEEPPSEHSGTDEKISWVDAVVANFCEKRRIRQSFDLARHGERSDA